MESLRIKVALAQQSVKKCGREPSFQEGVVSIFQRGMVYEYRWPARCGKSS